MIFGALGARSLTGEYATGMIRRTFAAMPHRRLVLLPKVTILAALVLPVALASGLASFVVGQSILAAKEAEASLGDPGVAAAMVYGALAVSVSGILGVELGALLRRTAAATTAISVAIIGSQIFTVALPEAARPYLPGMALQGVVTVRPSEASSNR